MTVSSVAVKSPPITTVANGRCTSAPAEPETAIGRKPNMAANAVSKIGLTRSEVPLRIRLFKLVTPFAFKSLKRLISTKPFSTATPKSTMNPTPAEMEKGIPLTTNANIPPMVAKGTATKIIRLCLTDFKAKYNKINISDIAIGSTMARRELASCSFSNSPP